MASKNTKAKTTKQTKEENLFNEDSFALLFTIMAFYDFNNINQRLERLEAKVDMLEKFM